MLSVILISTISLLTLYSIILTILVYKYEGLVKDILETELDQANIISELSIKNDELKEENLAVYEQLKEKQQALEVALSVEKPKTKKTTTKKTTTKKATEKKTTEKKAVTKRTTKKEVK